ncbi:MAG: tyrosine--tRNA ligase [Nocardioidaceae bacterium]|nr:tyrosine--tRNA ligase [Nocardioidaceae bacterium]
MPTHVLDDLDGRGLLAHTTDRDALRAELDRGPVTFYVGFDPTAPSLHMGNLVQLVTAKRLQQAGHRPLILVGGATGLIGDPKATGERTLNSAEVVAGWVERIRGQVSRLVDLDGDNAARVVNNLDWTASLSTLDFLRDIGKHFPVNRMLGRDVVRSRLEAGISYTEFSYVLLQSMDYLELFRRHGCRLQSGGSDQWGNITAGVELIRRAEGAQVHALATPLVTKADGTKYGKTETGTLWLDPELMSPYAFHQFWLHAEDSMVGTYLRIFSFRSLEEIDQVMADHEQRPSARLAQRVLAADVTALVHGDAERLHAEQAAQALFGRGDLAALPEATLAAALAEAPHASVERGQGLPSVVDALVATGLAASRSQARRAVQEGGAYVNNERVTAPDDPLPPAALLHDRFLVVRKGKRSVGVVDVLGA